METGAPSSAGSTKMLWAGRIISGLVVLFMILDGTLHLMKPSPVITAFAQLGYPIRLAATLGIIDLVCVLVYAIPRTSILGAILLTGYLGGAVATHLRVGSSLFGETLFPVYFGVLVWGGLFLRDEGLRALIPFRS
jgi:DoxX-like family